MVDRRLQIAGPSLDTRMAKKWFAFTNGTWFQLLGTQVDKDQVVFVLTSAEPYFRKTF